MPKYSHRRASDTRERQDRQEPYTGRTKSHQATRPSKNGDHYTPPGRNSGAPNLPKGYRDEKENAKGYASSFRVPNTRALPSSRRGPLPIEAGFVGDLAMSLLQRAMR